MLAITNDMAQLRAENVSLKQAMAVKVQEVEKKVETGEGSATSSKVSKFPNLHDKKSMGFLTDLSRLRFY